MSASSMTPKQRRKQINREMNERQRLEKIARKQQNVAQPGSGLSKGQRRRRNQAVSNTVRGYGPAPPIPYPRPQPGRSFGMTSFPETSSLGFGPRRSSMTQSEFIGSVFGSVDFATTQYYYNPGQSSTFPWLARIAQNYEKYVTVRVRFCFRPTVSGFATNGQSGKVILSFDYDASDPPPTSKQQVEDTWPHRDDMPYNEFCLELDPRQLNGQDSKYVRPGPLPAGTDIKTYDGGVLSVSTQGNTDTTEIGELHVEYTIELLVPILESSASIPVPFQVSAFSSGVPQELPSGVVTNLELINVQQMNPLGITISPTGSYTLPAGNFIVSFSIQALSGASTLTNLIVEVAELPAVPAVRTTVASPGTQYLGVSGCVVVSSNGSGTFTLTCDCGGGSPAFVTGNIVFQSVQ